jgi:hypothetical protein
MTNWSSSRSVTYVPTAKPQQEPPRSLPSNLRAPPCFRQFKHRQYAEGVSAAESLMVTLIAPQLHCPSRAILIGHSDVSRRLKEGEQ